MIGLGFSVDFLLKALYLQLTLNGSYSLHSDTITKYFEKQNF